VREKAIEGEDHLTDYVEDLCSTGKDEGKWTTKIDIFRKAGDPHLSLDKRDAEGQCNEECKAVQRACSAGMRDSEEKLVELLKDRAGVGALQREVCKSACKKTADWSPDLNDWKDELWKPLKPTMDPLPTKPPDAKSDPVKTYGPVIFDIVASTLQELGEEVATPRDIRACYDKSEALRGTTESSLTIVQKGIEDMLGNDKDPSTVKTKEGMRAGLSKIAGFTVAIGMALKEHCPNVLNSAARMFTLGGKMHDYCMNRVDVIYKPLVMLTIKGFDIHKQLNAFIGAWNQEQANAVGETLGRLLRAVDGEATESRSEVMEAKAPTASEEDETAKTLEAEL
jgi:hypothetical protein